MNEHILVVDDEAPIRDLLSTFFQKRDYKVTTAATAEEAQKSAKEPSLKLVILDIALGEEDGLQLLAALKGDHPKLPVIILTGMGFDDELLQEALEKGASGYVSKTLPLEQLLMEVHRALKQHPQAS
jgi:DNA-binding NtrC family response regulator